MGQHVTTEEIRKLGCERCGAKPGEACVRRDLEKPSQRDRHHRERVKAARSRKLPAKARVK